MSSLFSLWCFRTENIYSICITDAPCSDKMHSYNVCIFTISVSLVFYRIWLCFRKYSLIFWLLMLIHHKGSPQAVPIHICNFGWFWFFNTKSTCISKSFKWNCICIWLIGQQKICYLMSALCLFEVYVLRNEEWIEYVTHIECHSVPSSHFSNLPNSIEFRTRYFGY